MSYFAISGLVIRKYEKSDRDAIRRICCDTAYMGEPMEKFFDDQKILADFLTLYYTDYEPESLFVAELNKVVIGYLTGCKSLKRQKRIFITKILPRIILEFFLKRNIFKFKTRRFCFHCFKSFLRGEFNHPDFSGDYPASLHINVDCRFRDLGVGTGLIKKYSDYLNIEEIKGVQMSTTSGRDFFEKVGIVVLYCQKISFYSYLNHKDLFRITLGKTITMKGEQETIH